MIRYDLRALFCCFVLYATGAKAEDIATDNDVRCVMIGLQIAQSENPVARASGFTTAMYYIGRLDGRDPRLDLENAIWAEIVKWSKDSPEQRRAATVTCGKHLQARGASLTIIGDHITERSKKMMQLENSR